MNRESGFSLMELMIVVAIMLILAGIGFSNYVFSIQKSRDATRKNDLSVMAKAIESFANDFSIYPTSDNGELVACDYNNSGLRACSWGQPMAAYVGNQLVTYVSKLPTDPEGDQAYYYESTDGSSYNLYAALENDQDPSYQADLEIVCGNAACNYQLSESGVIK